MLKLGRYRHYRGGTYLVLHTAQHADTKEACVVYMNEAHGTYYVRSLKDFSSKVNEDSEDGGIPRFKLINEKT